MPVLHQRVGGGYGPTRLGLDEQREISDSVIDLIHFDGLFSPPNGYALVEKD
jgi:hypothetical protein